MRDQESAVLALKNAWQGAVQASAEVQGREAEVMALPATAGMAELDLDGFHRVAMAHAIAAQALRGVIEQLQRLRDSEAAS